MKKLFTLVALLGVALGASAFTAKMPLSQTVKHVNSDKLRQLEATVANLQAENELVPSENVQTRSYTDQSGVTWNLSFINLGNEMWAQLFYDPEEKPTEYENYTKWFTLGALTISRERKSPADPTQSITLWSFWPTNYLIRDGIPTMPQPTSDDDYAPYSIDNIVATGLPLIVNEAYQLGFNQASGSDQINGIGCFYLGSQMSDNTGAKKPFYQYISSAASNYNGTACAATPGSSFSFSTYDKNVGFISGSLDAYLNDANDTRIGSLLVNYDGDAYVDGFEPITKTFKVGDCHIVDCGVLDQDVMEEKYGQWLYDVDWGPLHRYYLMMCGENLVWPLASFQEDAYPGFNDDQNGPWLTAEDVSYQYTWLRCALYAPADVQGYTGTYTMFNPKYEAKSGYVEMKEGPKAWSALGNNNLNPSYAPYVDVDACRMAYRGYYSYWEPGATIQLGTTGGIIISAKDNYKDTIDIKYTGDVYYHNNPDDFSQYEKVSAIGTGTIGIDNVTAPKASLFVENGEIIVNLVNASDVAIYDMNGRAIARANESVSVKAPKGVYVVVVDGKATKVIL